LKTNENKFSKRLNSLLFGLSKNAFARKCAIKQTTMIGYLNGTSEPNLENLIKIAFACNVSVGWLAAGELTEKENLDDEGGKQLVADQNFPVRLKGELGIREPSFLAEKAEIPLERIRDFLAGKARPTHAEILHMAYALNISAQWLAEESPYDETSSFCIAPRSLIKQWVDDTIDIEGTEDAIVHELIFHSKKFRKWMRKKGWLPVGPDDGN